MVKVQGLLDGGVDPNYRKGLETPLIVASAKDHVEVVRILLNAHAQVDLENMEGITALHAASRNGSEEVIVVLLSAGADPNRVENDGWTSVHMASRYGHAAVLAELIKAGGDISKRARGITPLLYAATYGHLSVVRLLLERGAQGDAESIPDMYTALTVAAINDRGAVLLALIDAGADVDHVDGNGYTPLHWAAFAGNQEIIELLVESGADKTITIDNTESTAARDLLCACTSNTDILEGCQIEACKNPQKMTDLLNP